MAQRVARKTCRRQPAAAALSPSANHRATQRAQMARLMAGCRHARPRFSDRIGAALRAGLVLLACCSSGCSAVSGFHRDWRSPACCATDGSDLAGCWQGCWKSHTTGHQGKLQAIITRHDEHRYCARFHGTFVKVLPFEYSMSFTAAEAGEAQQFQGQKDLGRLAGGVYRFEGQATECDFVAHYTSCEDRGVFIMRRCGDCCQR